MRPTSTVPQVQPPRLTTPSHPNILTAALLFIPTWADPPHPTARLRASRTAANMPRDLLQSQMHSRESLEGETPRPEPSQGSRPGVLVCITKVLFIHASHLWKSLRVAEATACTNPWSLILNERFFNSIQMTNAHMGQSFPIPGNPSFEIQNMGLEGWLSWASDRTWVWMSSTRVKFRHSSAHLELSAAGWQADGKVPGLICQHCWNNKF